MLHYELLNVLKEERGSEYVEEHMADAEEAIFWLAHDDNMGIGCPLYEVLSSSQYRPNAHHTGPSTPVSSDFYEVFLNMNW
jgi:hypothetical protein